MKKKNSRDSPLTEKIEISGNYNGSDVGSGGSGSCDGVSGDGVSGVSSQWSWQWCWWVVALVVVGGGSGGDSDGCKK